MTEEKKIETAQTVEEQPAESAGKKKTTVKEQDDPLSECRHCHNWLDIKEPARVARLVQNTVEKYEAKLLEDGFKPSMAEFFKLMQLEKELQDNLMEKGTKIAWAGDETKTER